MPRISSIFALTFLMFAFTIWADPTTTTAPTTNPASLVVWDGETHNTGGGWIHTQGKEHIKTQDTESHSPKTAVAYDGEGDKWHGCGWNWTKWKAADATDITPYQNLVFWVKVTGDTKPTQLKVSLTSTNGKSTNQIDAGKYCPKVLDGDWQQVVIPLKDLTADAPDFEPQKTWELQLGNWNESPVKFTIYLDDISFSKDPAPAK